MQQGETNLEAMDTQSDLDDFESAFNDDGFADGEELDLSQQDGGETSQPEPQGMESQAMPQPRPEGDAAQNQAQAPASEYLTIRYNGQDMQINQQQAIELAQKGMNYDHVHSEMQQLRQAPEFAFLDRIAQASGMTRQQYVEYAQRQFEEQQIQTQVAQGVPEHIARDLHEIRQQQQRAEEERQANEAREQQQELWRELVREYPGITSLPPEVAHGINQGQTPLNAMRNWEIKHLRARVMGQETAQKNTRSTMGSAAGDGPAPKADPFIDAFNEEF